MIEEILFGTYTKKNSQGIYKMKLNTETKTLNHRALVAKISNPTYITKSKQNFIYAVDKYNNDGGVAVIDTNATPAQVVQHVVQPGTPPAYVTVTSDQKYVLDANYHEGTLHSYAIKKSGILEPVDTFSNTGKGPRPEQDGSHLHFVDETPDGKLVACDLGTDQVFVLDFNDGLFSVASTYQTESGFGPRHIVFAPNSNTAYLVGELSSQVEVLSYSAGQLKHIQIVKTIPETYTEHNGAAAIRISADGRFLYVSNRGFNTIAVFSINSDHTLNEIQNITTEGDFPRDFNFNSDQSFVICANQETDNVTLYTRNADDGKLTAVQKNIEVPEAVCVYVG
ncbi:lactonase family protein [Pediococcus claussenii]|uniref:6-phosphogluconolactonase n=1 Tax=Pediococcus claussenii (strain ATCC BAA-344 / DSM 14800 / JCM 18046 / KCTC 3811 / LMG 21948 / P06) TaxID=701521 RepID=G8PCT3_PEDCP|nr:lactonase family protein [Pediococcus claussenii]AEV95068.1 hypothetical protein PECL_794 [Pediococcus claussenii ATCC BAA-344]ANZ70256.1 6-phosphogluconolactonase [Pediococcus claussenii]ANZ72072.1 6-phosphogluconolactonase [Pediococcus claussenii]KRN18929.1 hypothetical protein IV79_GL001772 [Pediococcus claussenii]